MATVETRGPKQLELSTIDADWTSSAYMDIAAIAFDPGAAGDVISLKEALDSGPDIVPKLYSVDGSSLAQTFPNGLRTKPMIDFSECILSAGHKVIFTMMR